MIDPFTLPFVQRGLIEIAILSVPAGLLGTWIVLRGLAFFSHALGTATFPGLVLASGLGFAAPLGALGAAIAFSLLMLLLGRGKVGGQDAATALALVGCLSAGVILASDVFHSGAEVENLLFGSLLLVAPSDLAIAGAAALAVVAASMLVGARWLLVGFDFAGASALRTKPLPYDGILIGLIALATIAVLSAVGAVLVSAVFVVPAATARLLTNRLRPMQAVSIGLVAAEGAGGLWLSVKTNAPPGATISVVAGVTFAGVAAIRFVLSRASRAAVLVGAAAAVLALAGCRGSGAQGTGGDVKVVATTTQIADFVREVGGQQVEVDQVLQPNTDPHEYEPRPADVENAAGADIAFANGDNLDDWLGKVIDESGSGANVVDLGTKVPVKLPGESTGPEASKYDPHWWHDPRNAAAAVRAIATQLEQIDPAAASRFRANATSYLARIRRLDRGISTCMSSVPASRRKLVTDHDAFNYFAKRYGIDVVGAVIPSQTTQAQPSAQAVANLVDLIRSEHVKAVFPESSINPRLAQSIANETGARSDYTLYGDTLGPAGSAGTHLPADGAGERQRDGPGFHRRAARVPHRRPWMSASPELVEVRGLGAGYGRALAIEAVTFSVERGQTLALLGPNGGGKTTLLRALLGELHPRTGSLRVDSPPAIVPQTERTRLDYPVSALDVALMGRLARLSWWRRPGRADRRIATAALELVGLGGLATTTFGELSGGQRQRMLIARGLAQDAELLLLDEPFSGLDAVSASKLEDLITRLRADGRSVVVAEHDFQRALRMDRVLCLNRRQVGFGEPAGVLDLPTLQATYGGAIVPIPSEDGATGGLLVPPHHHEHVR